MKHIPKSEDVYVIMHGRMLKRSEKLHSCVVSDGCTIQITSRFRGEEGTRTKRTKRKRNEARGKSGQENQHVESVGRIFCGIWGALFKHVLFISSDFFCLSSAVSQSMLST